MYDDQNPLTQSVDLTETSAPEPEIDEKTKQLHTELQQQITINKQYKKKLIRNWTTNIDYRRGKTFGSQTDDDTITVNLDWSFTKTKQASLFSQVPEVRVSHFPESIAVPWVPAFQRRLNDNLRVGGIEAAMDEVMPDCINAAGFGVVLVAYEALTEDREVPKTDPSTLPPELQQEMLTRGTMNGQPVEMVTLPVTVDKRYTIRRISPADFLWPVDFTGSDFDNAPWLGHTGRLSWAEAKSRFSLDDSEKESLLGDETTVEERLSHDQDKERATYDNKIGYDELFLHEHYFDPEAKSFSSIRHIVWLHGKTDPVVDRQWEGQTLDQESGKVFGALQSPLRVLTLTYLTDESIPPSDSAIGRAQVNEINRGRTQTSRQRERRIPFNWFDVNRVDPAIQHALMRGTWQHSIPVQGDGTRIIGSVQLAAMHQENFMFDRVAKDDLREQWTVGPNQLGVGNDVETKGEASVIQSNFATRVSRERAKTGSFFVGIAQVMGGLMCLYEDPETIGQGFTPAFSESLKFSILADATILLDSRQRLDRIREFVNEFAKSGFVDLEPVLKEAATLVGLDPAVIRKPEPQKPEMPNISLRLTGGEDMMNPLLLAFLLKSGQGPDPKLIEQAKQLIQMSVVEPQPQPQQPGVPPQGAPPGALPPNPGPLPQPPPPNVGEANPQMTIMPTVGKRSDMPPTEGR